MLYPSLDIKILPGENTDPKYTNFTWNVTSYGNYTLVVQLYFETPEFISQRADVEWLQIVIRNNLLFMSKSGHLIDQDTTLKRKLLPQLKTSDEEGKSTTFLRGLKATRTTSAVVVTVLLILHFLLKLALNHLWSMIDSQQLIVLLPLLDIRLPAKTNLTFSFLMQIAAFDYIETGYYFEKMFETQSSEPLD